MFYHAEINQDNICITVGQSTSQIIGNNIIALDAYDISLLGQNYNNGLWESTEVHEPEPNISPEPTPNPLELISEQLKALSQKYESDQSSTQEMILTLASAIAEVYEKLDAEASK